MSHAYCVTTYNNGPWLRMTLDNLPPKAEMLLLDKIGRAHV